MNAYILKLQAKLKQIEQFKLKGLDAWYEHPVADCRILEQSWRRCIDYRTMEGATHRSAEQHPNVEIEYQGEPNGNEQCYT